jgi:phage gpG-like protein
MVFVRFTHRLDLTATRQLLAGRQGGVARDMLRRGLLVETQAKRNLGGIGGPKRIDTGRLRASINTQLVIRDGRPIAVVGTNVNYARFVHDGTGLYGPRGRRITPVTSSVLRFKRPKGWAPRLLKSGKKAKGSGWVYAKSIAGMQGNPFLRNALRAARG